MDFEWSSFWIVGTIARAIAKSPTIWNLTFKTFGFQMFPDFKWFNISLVSFNSLPNVFKTYAKCAFLGWNFIKSQMLYSSIYLRKMTEKMLITDILLRARYTSGLRQRWLQHLAITASGHRKTQQSGVSCHCKIKPFLSCGDSYLAASVSDPLRLKQE